MSNLRGSTIYSRTPLGAIAFAEAARRRYGPGDRGFANFCRDHGCNWNAIKRLLTGHPNPGDNATRLIGPLAAELGLDLAQALALLAPAASSQGDISVFKHLTGNRPKPPNMTFQQRLSWQSRRLVSEGQLVTALRASALFATRGYPGVEPDAELIEMWPDDQRSAWAALSRIDAKLRRRGCRVPASWAVWRLVVSGEKPAFSEPLADQKDALQELMALRLGLRVLAPVQLDGK